MMLRNEVIPTMSVRRSPIWAEETPFKPKTALEERKFEYSGTQKPTIQKHNTYIIATANVSKAPRKSSLILIQRWVPTGENRISCQVNRITL